MRFGYLLIARSCLYLPMPGFQLSSSTAELHRADCTVRAVRALRAVGAMVPDEKFWRNFLQPKGQSSERLHKWLNAVCLERFRETVFA